MCLPEYRKNSLIVGDGFPEYKKNNLYGGGGIPWIQGEQSLWRWWNPLDRENSFHVGDVLPEYRKNNLHVGNVVTLIHGEQSPWGWWCSACWQPRRADWQTWWIWPELSGPSLLKLPPLLRLPNMAGIEFKCTYLRVMTMAQFTYHANWF